MITTDQAKEIAIKHISEALLSKIYYTGETPRESWVIYGLPQNCIYIGLRNSLIDESYWGSSVVIAIDKNNGSIRYFGSAGEE